MASKKSPSNNVDVYKRATIWTSFAAWISVTFKVLYCFHIMSISEADNMLWLAYADFIRELLQVDIVGPKDVIWPYPVTQRGTAAGKAIPHPVTNFLVYNLADNLRPAKSPDSKTAGSYTEELRQYVLFKAHFFDKHSSL